MAWNNQDPEKRARDAKTYGDPEYRKNRAAARVRAGGRCERCGRRRQLQCDHVIPVSRGGTHALANLQMLCTGTAGCHEKKTASEGGGFRSAGTDPAPRPRTSW